VEVRHVLGLPARDVHANHLLSFVGVEHVSGLAVEDDAAVVAHEVVAHPGLAVVTVGVVDPVDSTAVWHRRQKPLDHALPWAQDHVDQGLGGADSFVHLLQLLGCAHEDQGILHGKDAANVDPAVAADRHIATPHCKQAGRVLIGRGLLRCSAAFHVARLLPFLVPPDVPVLLALLVAAVATRLHQAAGRLEVGAVDAGERIDDSSGTDCLGAVNVHLQVMVARRAGLEVADPLVDAVDAVVKIVYQLEPDRLK